MRLYSIQALQLLAFLLTTTSAVPANNDIEAESDLVSRDIPCTTDCWSDGYGEVGVGQFFIHPGLSTPLHCDTQNARIPFRWKSIQPRCQRDDRLL